MYIFLYFTIFMLLDRGCLYWNCVRKFICLATSLTSCPQGIFLIMGCEINIQGEAAEICVWCVWVCNCMWMSVSTYFSYVIWRSHKCIFFCYVLQILLWENYLQYIRFSTNYTPLHLTILPLIKFSTLWSLIKLVYLFTKETAESVKKSIFEIHFECFVMFVNHVKQKVPPMNKIIMYINVNKSVNLWQNCINTFCSIN